MHRGCGACGRRSLTGAGPGRTVRTTGPAKGNPVPVRPAAPRAPAAARPDRRWVVDFVRHEAP